MNKESKELGKEAPRFLGFSAGLPSSGFRIVRAKDSTNSRTKCHLDSLNMTTLPVIPFPSAAGSQGNQTLNNQKEWRRNGEGMAKGSYYIGNWDPLGQINGGIKQRTEVGESITLPSTNIAPMGGHLEDHCPSCRVPRQVPC